MNKTFHIGRITHDLDLRYTPTGLAVLNFQIAVNETFGSGENRKETTDFFRVVTWRQNAENVHKFCKKGSKILVDGRLKNRTFEDPRQERTTRTITEIQANRIEFLDPAPKSQDEAPFPGEDAATEAGESLPEEDIPF